MANKNGSDNGGSKNPDEVICERLKEIKKEKNAASSAKQAGETTQLSKEIAKGYKICCLSKAEETNKLYQDIMTCVTIANFKKTEIAQKNIEVYIKKDDDIEKLIKESSKLLNELRVSLDEANTAVCALDSCLTKHKLALKEGDDPLSTCLKIIVKKTKDLQLEGQNAFDSAVIIAGIQTFTNTASLKDFITLLMIAIKTFKECVASNIISTGVDVTTVRDDLNKIVEQLAQAICDKNAEFTTSQGLQAVIDFICEGECDEGCIDLCKDFDACCESDDEDNSRPKKKGKQSSDAN